MRLSTRSRYGVRLMYELALHYGKGALILKDIARAQDISEKYLSHIVMPLKGVGLIQGNRGAHGGYVLARPPSEITIKDIVEILEGDLNLVQCSINPGVCKRSMTCPSRELWVILKEKIVTALDETSLEDLIQRHKEQAVVYSI